MVSVVCLSLAAAFLFATSASAQQRAARRALLRHSSPAPERAPGRLTHMRHLVPNVVVMARRLLRDRLWLTGWLCNVCGFMTQAAALHLGSLGVVQPLLVTQLLFALVLTSVLMGRKLRASDLIGGAAICGGLILLLSVRGAAPLAGSPDRPKVALALLAAALVTVVLIGIAGNLPPSARAATLGVAAGQFFALSAVLTKLTTDDLLHRGVGATALDWPGYALALTTVFGLLLEQSAFASGPLPSALTAMTIVNPVASYLIGVLAADVLAPSGAGALSAVGVSALFLVVGIVTLAHSPSVREVAETPGQATAEALVTVDSPR
jgi:hypothetical protein